MMSYSAPKMRTLVLYSAMIACTVPELNSILHQQNALIHKQEKEIRTLERHIEILMGYEKEKKDESHAILYRDTRKRSKGTKGEE